MKRKRTIRWWSISILLGVAFGVWGWNTNENWRNENLSKQLPLEQTPAPSVTQTENLAALAQEVILSSSSHLGSKELTPSFLSWVEEKYGPDVLTAIADTIQKATYEKNQWIPLTKKSLAVLIDEYKGILESKRLQKEQGIYVLGDGSCQKGAVTLRFAGDINLAQDWSTTRFLEKQNNNIAACFSPELLKVMRSADLMMLNNEFTYSTRGSALKGKAYTFRAKPDRVKALQDLGVDVVSLANNHCYDYGEDAFLDTLTTLQQAEIPYVGAGMDLKEAMRPVYYILNGRKVAIVSASQIERSRLYTRQATKDSPGILRTKDPELFLQAIEKAKKNSDYVIAYVHWGTEHKAYIDSSQRPLAQAFIDAGADAVIGGHTHCLQGFEFYQGKPIVYSLGNYWFNSKTLDTGIVELKMSDTGEVQVFFLPCIQKKCRTTLTTNEEEKKRIIDYMEKISYNVRIDANGKVTEKK